MAKKKDFGSLTFVERKRLGKVNWSNPSRSDRKRMTKAGIGDMSKKTFRSLMRRNKKMEKKEAAAQVEQATKTTSPSTTTGGEASSGSKSGIMKLVLIVVIIIIVNAVLMGKGKFL